jgi:monofunctional glycosyltransferase
MQANSKHRKKRIVHLLMKLGIIAGCTLFTFHLLLVVYTACSAILLSWFNPPFTSLSIGRAVFRNYKTQPHVFVPFKKIKPQVRSMFLKLEDSTFYSNHGINIEAMKMAYYRNKMLGVPLFGGSTITQQITRTLFLDSQKSYVRKYIEVIMSLVFDAMVRKDRIFELYLNYIEWGRGVYGIGSAAYYYYQKGLAFLSIEESIRLAVIITNPIRYNVTNYGDNLGMAYRYSVLVSNFMNN